MTWVTVRKRSSSVFKRYATDEDTDEDNPTEKGSADKKFGEDTQNLQPEQSSGNAKTISKRICNSCKAKNCDKWDHTDHAEAAGPDSFRRALYADTGSCEFCGGILSLCELCEATVLLAWQPRSGSNNWVTFPNHHTLGDLQLSAESCPLCWSLLEIHQDGTSTSGYHCAAANHHQRHALNIKEKNELCLITCGVVANQMFELCVLNQHLILGGNPNKYSRPFWSATALDIESRLSIITEWLAECNATHESCQETQQTYPLRLLDLDDIFAIGKVRLVMTRPHNEPKYCALSYCWGEEKSPFLKTTLKTLQHHQQGVSVLNLPQTYRDAIRVARGLGFRYLWIDALCIVQDYPKEWSSEALRMASIYQTSQLTIAASSAADSYGGLFLDRPNRKMVRASLSPNSFVDPSKSSEYPAMIMQRQDAEQVWLSFGERPLARRGWVLQEQVFSRRTVHFMEEQIIWQCRSSLDLESGIPLADYDIKTVTGLTGADQNMDWPWKLWWPLITDYSRREFTHDEDRLPAMAGFVDYFVARFGEESILGLWKGTFPFDLTWKPPYRKPHLRKNPNAKVDIPSWTWLSSASGVEGCPVPDRCFSENGELDNSFQICLTIVDCKVEWEGAPYVSNLKSSELIVRSRMADLEVDRYGNALKNGEFIDSLFVQFDSLILSANVALLLIYKELSKQVSCFLILSEVQGSPPMFKRVGTGRLDSGRCETLFSKVFDTHEEVNIHLV